MLADTPFDPPLERGLTAEHPALRFNMPSELRDWFHSERLWMTGLKEAANNIRRPDALAVGSLNAPIRLLSEKMNAVESLIAQDEKAEIFNELLNDYVILIKTRKLINSCSRLGKFISTTKENDPSHAARLASVACSSPLDISQISNFSDWGRAVGILPLVELGLNENPPNLDPFLERFSNDWSKRFAAIESAQKQTADASSTALGAFVQQLQESNQARESFEKAAASALADGDAKLNAIAETYRTELTLQAPTNYWTSKKTRNLDSARNWAIAFAAAAVVGAVAVGGVWNKTAEPFLAAYQTSLIKASAPIPLSYGIFLPTLAVAFLLVWVLRIISKQLLANLALSNDAAERVTMVETFLSLMQKPDHVKEDDRILILSALFRPAPSSNDDGTPPNWFDLLMQRIRPEK
jgi:hypothetical protein